jgi:NADPH-dependent 2,4-dienoyl-CoA reductase/sulfur reductase-like enzyme
VALQSFDGGNHVEAVCFRDRSGVERRVRCDAAALGFGLKSEVQLAELAGCEMVYDPTFRQWFPKQDAVGRCGGGVYVAGDGSRIGGADAAEISGGLAAQALLADRVATGVQAPHRSAELERLLRFQRGLAKAFAWPHQSVRELADDVVLCRCENVTIGEVREVLRMPNGPTEVNRVKAATRCGMGRCQGRFCGAACAELVATELGREAQPLDRLRAQPPIKPLPFAALADDPVR